MNLHVLKTDNLTSDNELISPEYNNEGNDSESPSDRHPKPASDRHLKTSHWARSLSS